MTFLEQVARAENADFQMQVRQAAVTHAIEVMALVPANTPEDIELQRKRAALAREVLLDSNRLARAFAPAVASNAALVEEFTDSDLQYTLNTYWDALAGIVQPPA
jgi:hypothetical protein